jgi:hypothetical protein
MNNIHNQGNNFPNHAIDFNDQAPPAVHVLGWDSIVRIIATLEGNPEGPNGLLLAEIQQIMNDHLNNPQQ